MNIIHTLNGAFSSPLPRRHPCPPGCVAALRRAPDSGQAGGGKTGVDSCHSDKGVSSGRNDNFGAVAKTHASSHGSRARGPCRPGA
eukprot:scaffold3886_cov399-Prasinococcus_capsulatus_cf.AAC.27